MLTLVLAETELELVPEEIKRHPAIRAAAARKDKRAKRTLLDASHHHTAMDPLPEKERRGRPDIAHYWLLLGLDSVLNKRDGLRLLVHTRNDELIRVAPETRLMRHYTRFVGLMEQLFAQGSVPPGKDLLTIEEGWSLKHVLEKAVDASTPKVALTEHGRQVAPAAWVRERADAADDLCIVMGGFPHGDYKSDISSLVDEEVAFGTEPLSVWTAEMEVIAHWEAVTGAFDAE